MRRTLFRLELRLGKVLCLNTQRRNKRGGYVLPFTTQVISAYTAKILLASLLTGSCQTSTEAGYVNCCWPANRFLSP